MTSALSGVLIFEPRLFCDERGFLYYDKTLNTSWPLQEHELILSTKDLAAGALSLTTLQL